MYRVKNLFVGILFFSTIFQFPLAGFAKPSDSNQEIEKLKLQIELERLRLEQRKFQYNTPPQQQVEQQEAPQPLPLPPPLLKAPSQRSRKSREVVEDPGVDQVGALLRSAVLPGWGQVAAGNEQRGYWVGGITLGLFAGGWGSYLMSESAANRYLGYGAGTSQGEFDAAYRDWENWASINHAVVVCFGAAYLYNLVDAWQTAKPKMVQSQKTTQLMPLLTRQGGAGAVLVSVF